MASNSNSGHGRHNACCDRPDAGRDVWAETYRLFENAGDRGDDDAIHPCVCGDEAASRGGLSAADKGMVPSFRGRS